MMMLIIIINAIIIRRAFGPRRARSWPQPLAVLVCSPLLCEWAPPRVLGGRSRGFNPPLDPGQSVAGPWRLHMLNGFFRRIHDPPLKCRDSSRRSTSNLKTAFFKKVLKLKVFLKVFRTSSRWSRDTVKMQCIELAAILVALSDFQKNLLGPSRAPEEPPGRRKSSGFAPSIPRSSSK